MNKREYSPWVGGEFRWRLGLRPLDLADWIEIGNDYDEQMAAKAVARERNPATVFVALPAAAPACAEVLDTLIDHLVATWPDHFERTSEAVLNHRTGDRILLDGSVHPLDAAARLVQEDLIVMVPVAGRLVFAAGSVCFPNRWDLRSKLGLPLTAVHAPVSRLNDQLADPIERFFARLTPEKSFWRLGWGVIDTPALYQAVDGTGDTRPSSPTGDDVHVRVERETLRRFPGTGSVLFTIRTYITPARLIATDPESASRLAAAVDAMPDDVRAYKQIDAVSDALAELFAGR